MIVKAQDFSFSPNLLTINTGDQVKVALENDGKIEHDFEIVGTDIHVHAGPGSQESIFLCLNSPENIRQSAHCPDI